MTLHLLSIFKTYYYYSSSSPPLSSPPAPTRHATAVSFNRPSLSLLLRSLSHFGVVLGLCYLCEFHPPNFHGEKLYDRDMFFFLTFLLIGCAALTVKENGPDPNYTPPKSASSTPAGKEIEARSRPKPPPDSTVLNRDQTEEWKGWMQFMFLLYHYYAASETYNSIRIMITCYVWMTGFGNFSFFYIKRDFSLVRVLQMLWRLNFLVTGLCLAMGNTYILYYICPLHTFFFGMVYATMRLAEGWNHTRRKVRYKLFLLSIVIFLTWDLPSPLFSLFNSFLSTSPCIGAKQGTLWEWYFRTSLDHWSTFLGMCFALNYPVLAVWVAKVESLEPWREWRVKAAVGMPLLATFVWWARGPFMEGKLLYNASNAYLGIIPLTTYIYFRNLTPYLRSRTMSLLHTIGKTTLETYLLQHHIWLTSNAKSLLILVKGYPKMNFLVVTAVYFTVSRKAYRLTMELRGMLLPNDLSFCLRSLSVMFLSVLASLAAAAVMTDFGSAPCGVWSVFLVSISSGIVLDSLIERRLGPDSREAGSGVAPRLLPHVSTVAAGLVFATLLSAYMGRSAGRIEPLPFACSAGAARGRFAELQCSEESRDGLLRAQGLGSVAGCGGYVWGWEEAEVDSGCRFVARSTKELRDTLAGRTVAFVGESHLRNQFYALLRLLGSTSEKPPGYHSDMRETVGSATVEFYWKPYVADQVEYAREWAKGSEAAADVLVLGNGQWDCLHNPTHFEDYKASLHDLIGLLEELKRRKGIGVVFVTPPTVNDSRLGTDEKKEFMTEEHVHDYRDQQVLTASTVFDLFVDFGGMTKERVQEAYDGVHYPDDVYDALVQVVVQSFDWALPAKEASSPSSSPEPGSMGNPILGLFMVLVSTVSIFCMDSYLGLGYLPSLFLSDAPRHTRLWDEAFSALHKKIGVASSEVNKEEDEEDEREGLLELKKIEATT
eukprot:CAMPEP_0197546000 /NCGR_PEP_ID=MMETSP1320-20131121/798_1 /TAXON_ID=91990 /ORGANISM="Bolidomonas sp., Strain RCC2347" /LENGTH=939 /DNA_ID=CAMNT_0043105547 /DNA_START=212 /DNA_END=3031 /DNA_ORIENTATION=+